MPTQEVRNGVALELCAPLLQPITQNAAFLRSVCYVEDAQHGLAADIAKWTIGFFKMGLTRSRPDREQWANSFLTAWEQRVIYFAPLLKDKAFANEKEWRLIVEYGPEDWKLLKIQQKQSLISRHLTLSFGPRVPLSSVMVGPCRHPAVSRVSVGSILGAKGYPIDQFDTGEPSKVRVSNSKVPFQTT